MAELLTRNGWREPDTFGAVLSEALSDDYWVVEGPMVQGRTLDMVVVGPQGLFALHIKPWVGEVKPAWGAPWQVTAPDGQVESMPNPAMEARQDTAPLAGFARDELHSKEEPAVYHLLVLTEPGARLAPGIAPDMMITTPGNVAAVILTMPVPGVGGVADVQARRALAYALHQRKPSSSESVSEPFVFRSGGLLGGKKVRTIGDAVKHMDHYPEDGIYHLNNGTLAAWLEGQGAQDLADLAREVLRTRESDPRVPLEIFLIGTGLVDRPQLEVRPNPLNLGCVIAGSTCSGRIKLRKASGRGYLFGHLSTNQPWLRVEPRSFSGGPVEARVTVDTAGLPVSSQPLQANLVVNCSASMVPLSVPVRVRVSGEPSALSRFGLRPLADALLAGLIGGAIGWLLGSIGGLGAPAVVDSPNLFWTVAIGLLWGIFGLARGLGQRPAWTIRYASMRYLASIGLWLLGLGGGAAIGAVIRNLNSGQSAAPASGEGLRLVLIAMALAIVPATISEIRAARRADDTPFGSERRTLVQPLLVGLAVVALVAALAMGVRLAGPTWQELTEAGTVDQAQTWIEQRWQELNDTVERAADRFYLLQYNRPGKVPPTATPVTSATPSGDLGP